MPQARLEPVPSSCLFDIGLAAFVAGFASDGRVSFRSRQRAGHGEGGAVDAVIRGAVGASLGALGKRRPRRPCTGGVHGPARQSGGVASVPKYQNTAPPLTTGSIDRAATVALPIDFANDNRFDALRSHTLQTPGNRFCAGFPRLLRRQSRTRACR